MRRGSSSWASPLGLPWAECLATCSGDPTPRLEPLDVCRPVSPSPRVDEEVRQRLVIVKRGQSGIGALTLMLITIVTLAAIGQSWVAGTVATTGLAVVVAIFVTGQYQDA